MVAEDQSSPLTPERTDPWTEGNEGDEEGGWPAEYVEGDQNEPGSQAPPSGAAVPGDEETTDGGSG